MSINYLGPTSQTGMCAVDSFNIFPSLIIFVHVARPPSVFVHAGKYDVGYALQQQAIWILGSII